MFLTDVHLGSNMAPIAVEVSGPWFESQSYPRFTDVLYNIEKINPKPDFILIGGDNVEYNNERWIRDFKSIIDDYSNRTGIEIYAVPGNHDRYDSESTRWSWDDLNASGGNDNLEKYFEVMKKPEGVISLFVDNVDIMDADKSGVGGYNRYNYYFNHYGFQVIGLDSGEDTGKWDPEPEGSGLSSFVMGELGKLIEKTPRIPRIIFMHHPVYANQLDPSKFMGVPKGQEKTDMGEIAENEAIVNNWKKFINNCNSNGTQLILSGHTHDSLVFNSSDNELVLSNWVGNKTYPLYIQTQSASKNDDYGYRIINVENGKAIPKESVTNVTKYEKVFADIDSKKDLNLLSYDSDGKEIIMENNGKAKMFVADDSNRKIIYDDTEDSKFEVRNNNSFDTFYNLQLQKREEGAEIEQDFVPAVGYQINNPELCGDSEYFCSNFIYLKKKSDYTILGFKDIEIKKESSNIVSIDWSDIKADSIPYKMSGVKFGINGNYSTTYSRLPVTLAVDLNSPGELRAYDKDGNVTGLINGEVAENIPNSMYIPESETVYIFGNTREAVADGLRTQVVGAYEATYDLTITLSENDEEKGKIMANDVLTNDDTTHQFSVDWEALGRGEKGVTMEFDKNKDGDFEKSISSDGSLSFPRAKLNTEKYSANEGAEVIFNASASSDSDGSIALYEWDFDGDGVYDATSSTSTIAHIYGDDFQGKNYVKVTDNEGLTDTSSIASAEVTIVNTDPVVSISRFEIADTMDKFILEADFIDSGWLDTHIALIDWGDGGVENILITEENTYPDATGKIIGMHRYNKLKEYLVKLIVTDDNGGVVTSEVALESPRQIKESVLLKLETVQTNNKNTLQEINKAKESLENSISAEYWQDDFHLDLHSMPKFFSQEQKTTKSLARVLEDKNKYEGFQDTQKVQEIIDELSRSDIFLARSMVYEAGNLMAENLKSAKSWIKEILKL
ncbi:MAG: metallophosphoesterase [Candidatus Izemoplasmatales bacterium]|nr:metallophosphoesterase [Candidatus Izemoplasmatales bacterium]